MNTIIRTLVALAFIAVLQTSCTNSPSPVVTTTDNSISGMTSLTDAYLNPVTDLSGIVVTVHSPTWDGVDTTASDGVWSITDVPAGVYEIKATKVSCDTAKSSNIQYVGTGAYKVSRLKVHESVASDFVSGASASIFWKYKRNPEDSTQIWDSTAHLNATVTSNNVTNYPLRFTLTEASNSSCTSFIAEGGEELLSVSGLEKTYEFLSFSQQLKALYGNSLVGRTFYLQIRPYGVYGPGGSCFEPYVVELTF